MLRLADAWIWDSWIADDGDRYHLFFLRAPRLGDHGLRHTAATYRDAGVWHMLITARDKDAPRLYDGVLAHATSDDLATWERGPPVTEPAGFDQIEVPQVRLVDAQHVLVFTCHPEEQSPEQIAAFGPHSTWAFVGFRNQEPEGILSFDILDPIPVTVRDGELSRA